MGAYRFLWVLDESELPDLVVVQDGVSGRPCGSVANQLRGPRGFWDTV